MNTTTEAQLREWVAQGMKQIEIAALVGVPQNMVSATMRVLGITPAYPKSGKRYVHDTQKYLELLSQGMTLKEVSAATGTPFEAISKNLAQNGLPTTARAYLKWKAQQ